MISMFARDSNGAMHVVLPRPAGWNINATRPHSSRTALDGHVIHQTSSKSISTAETSYINEVDRTDSDKVVDMDARVSSCILSDGYGVYEAIFDARPIEADRSTRVNLSIRFWVVRQIL